MSKRNQTTLWQLDHSARFYPVVNTKKSQSLFCLGATLSEDVDAGRLRQAVNLVAPHFPTICARLKRGFFWYKLEKNDAPIEVLPLSERSLAPIDASAPGGHCFRLSCGGREVRLEILHALCDGTGAMEFFRATIERYEDLTRETEDRSGEEFTEDGFEKYYDKKARSVLRELAGITPHRHSGTLLKGGYMVDELTLSAAELVAAARAQGASLTEYLTGMLACAIERVSLPKKPVVMMVPVNLRGMFPSKTVRNFTLFVRVVIQPNSLDSPPLYVAEAKRQLREHVNKQKLSAQLSTTVRGVKMVGWVPLPVKRALIGLGRRLMRSRQTMILSNLGRVELPSCVESAYFRVNASVNNVQNLGVVTVGDKCTLSFTRAIEERALTEALYELLGAADAKAEE